jgi:hypothetical protein
MSTGSSFAANEWQQQSIRYPDVTRGEARDFVRFGDLAKEKWRPDRRCDNRRLRMLDSGHENAASSLQSRRLRGKRLLGFTGYFLCGMLYFPEDHS